MQDKLSGRKFMCQLIYKELESIKVLMQEQYDVAIEKSIIRQVISFGKKI